MAQRVSLRPCQWKCRIRPDVKTASPLGVDRGAHPSLPSGSLGSLPTTALTLNTGLLAPPVLPGPSPPSQAPLLHSLAARTSSAAPQRRGKLPESGGYHHDVNRPSIRQMCSSGNTVPSSPTAFETQQQDHLLSTVFSHKMASLIKRHVLKMISCFWEESVCVRVGLRRSRWNPEGGPLAGALGWAWASHPA